MSLAVNVILSSMCYHCYDMRESSVGEDKRIIFTDSPRQALLTQSVTDSVSQCHINSK